MARGWTRTLKGRCSCSASQSTVPLPAPRAYARIWPLQGARRRAAWSSRARWLTVLVVGGCAWRHAVDALHVIRRLAARAQEAGRPGQSIRWSTVASATAGLGAHGPNARLGRVVGTRRLGETVAELSCEPLPPAARSPRVPPTRVLACRASAEPIVQAAAYAGRGEAAGAGPPLRGCAGCKVFLLARPGGWPACSLVTGGCT